MLREATGLDEERRRQRAATMGSVLKSATTIVLSTIAVLTVLATLGCGSLDELIDQTVPRSIRQEGALDWPALSEAALLARMRAVAAKNTVMTSLIGQGYYGTVTPPAIQRNILENPAWYTAYTPYQPEIAQGRLEALLNFQTMVTDLTGLDISDADLEAALRVDKDEWLNELPGIDEWFARLGDVPEVILEQRAGLEDRLRNS